MVRTYQKVEFKHKRKSEKLTPVTAAQGIDNVFKILEGRWTLVILFNLFGGNVLRFSELDRAIPAISQQMLHSAASADGGRWNSPAHSLPGSSA